MRPVKEMTQFAEECVKELIRIAGELERLPTVSLSELIPERTLLVSIDINNGFAKAGALYSDRTEALIPKTVQLFQNAVDHGYGVRAFSDCHTSASPEFSSYPLHCMEGTEEPKLIEELAFLQGQMLLKNSTNGLFVDRPNLEQIETVVVTGCCTDICIYQYAVTLKAWANQQNQQLRVLVPLALVDTYDAPGHNADLMNVMALESMRQNGVELAADLIY